MTTEEFFATLLRYAQGRQPEDDVAAAIASNLALSQERERLFQSQFPPGSPELNFQLRGEMEKCFADYFAALTPLTQQLSPEAVEAALPELQRAVKALRGAQVEYQQSIAEGPTVLPYLNRFLLHYEVVRGGEDGSKLQTLVAEHPTFLQWLSKELAKRDVDPFTSTLLYQLRSFFSSVESALSTGEPLPEVAEDISEIGRILAEALLVEPHQTEQGPTPIPAVNQVFEALANLTGDHEEIGYMLDLLSQCRYSLRSTCPTRSKPEVIQALSDVLSTVESMEAVFRGQGSFEALEGYAERLESQANTLHAMVQEIVAGEVFKSELFEEHTRDLPPLYQSLLLPAYRMMEAGGSPAEVEDAADYLEDNTDYYESLLAQAPDEDSKVLLEESLASARDAAKLLRNFAEEGNPALLSLICLNLRQSTEKLRNAGVPIR